MACRPNNRATLRTCRQDARPPCLRTSYTTSSSNRKNVKSTCLKGPGVTAQRRARTPYGLASDATPCGSDLRSGSRTTSTSRDLAQRSAGTLRSDSSLRSLCLRTRLNVLTRTCLARAQDHLDQLIEDHPAPPAILFPCDRAGRRLRVAVCRDWLWVLAAIWTVAVRCHFLPRVGIDAHRSSKSSHASAHLSAPCGAVGGR